MSGLLELVGVTSPDILCDVLAHERPPVAFRKYGVSGVESVVACVIVRCFHDLPTLSGV